MPYNELLANRVREALEDAGEITEKTMFGGLCFMVDEKMCVCVGSENLLCRIGEAARLEVVEWPGCREMRSGGRLMKDFVYVEEAQVATQAKLMAWMEQCLAFNKTVKVRTKKKR